MKKNIAMALILSCVAIPMLVFTAQAHAETVYVFEQDVHYYVESDGSWSLEHEDTQSTEYRYIDSKPWTTYHTWHRNVYVFINSENETVNTVYGDWEYQGSHTE